jgi:hypothetical protein
VNGPPNEKGPDPRGSAREPEPLYLNQASRTLLEKELTSNDSRPCAPGKRL